MRHSSAACFAACQSSVYPESMSCGLEMSERLARVSRAVVLGLVVGSMGGCVSDGGLSGAGGMAGSGGTIGTGGAGGCVFGCGGAGGAGGSGGVSASLGWCTAESIDDLESSPTEIDMAVDALGNVVVVWRDYAGSAAVWSNRWTPGEGWGTSERLQTEDGPTIRPRVAMNANGQAVAAWEQSDCMSSYDIWSRRWTPNEGWGAAERIETADGAALFPEIAIDSSGNAVAVWTQADGAGMHPAWSNRWTQDVGWGTPERIQSSDSWASDAQVAVDLDGNAVATWRERNSENIYELWLNRWTPDEGWGTPERSDATESVGKYQMALDPSGHALAVWSTGYGQGFDRGLWSARWTGAWEPAEQLVDDRRTRDPKLAFDASGDAVATWMYWSGADTGGARIWSGRWTPDEGWGGIVELHDAESPEPGGSGFTTHGWSWEPEVAVDADGNALVVWEEADDDADGQRINIWSSGWTPGEGWGDAERIEHEESYAASPQVTFDADGNGMTVWSQNGGLRSSRFELGCTNDGGAGGMGGVAGAGGIGGAGGDPCEGVVCPDGECRSGGACNPEDGRCTYATVALDGAACSEGACLDGGCGRLGAFACTEQGILDAIAEGGGPRYFACDEPTTVVPAERIVIDNDVILDGEGELILDGTAISNVINVEPERSVELQAIRVIANLYRGMIVNRGSLTVVESTVEGVDNYSGALTVIDTEVRLLGIRNSLGAVTLTRVRMSAPAPSVFQAVYNAGGTMTVTDSTISGFGDKWSAPAVFNFSGGILNIENTTISGNTSLSDGVIHNDDATMTLSNTAVSDNITGRGPSVYNRGTMTLTNSTVSGGTVLYECGSYFNGYGIGNAGTLTVTNSTVTANTTGGLDNRGEATVTNSVIDGGCVQFGDDAATVSGGYNIVGGTDACGFDEPTDLVDVSSLNLALGPLSDNGGPTMTHALLPGSVAIDTIPAMMCEVTEDQRGEPRPAGGMCDVGAFEVQP